MVRDGNRVAAPLRIVAVGATVGVRQQWSRLYGRNDWECGLGRICRAGVHCSETGYPAGLGTGMCHHSSNVLGSLIGRRW